MTFPFDITIQLNQSGITGIQNKTIKVNGGITTFLGPNGSGKTQLLRGLKNSLGTHSNGKKIRYVSAGRLGPMETYRSDYDGQRGGRPRFDEATFGNKSSTTRRHQNETILGDFGTLSERPDILIKVQERLRKLFKRDLTLDWDGGVLKVFFSRVDETNNNNYSSAREASGLLHLVAILASLYDDEVGCLLIDEPEVSLHPQLQSFVMDEIIKVAGANNQPGKKLVFISTHSTEFIEISSVQQLSTIVFCKDILDQPVQIDPTIGEFQSRKLQALLTRLGQEHKLALFCHSPLLVEGPSDEIICSAINRKLNINLEAAGSQILPVTGKGQFPVVIKLMRLIGKKPALLGDADALTDNLDIISVFTTLDKANFYASELGHRDAPEFARNIYNDFCQLIANNWADIQSHAEQHYYWINRDTDKDELIAKRRSAFCWLFTTDDSTLSSIDNGGNWLTIKSRLSRLLELLEKLGCFILRKGTIEAYYQYVSTLTNDEKPNAASYEVNGLISETTENVASNYSDIIRALDYCSQAEKINEAEAIRDLLLAIVSPALAKINNESTENELKIYSKNLFGAKSSLFDLAIEVEGEDIYLIVNLASDILEVNGFPLKIKKGSNPIEIVNNSLRLN
ncbi:ATP-dependent nuclease [Snuella lapsa]|uniref:AAA+ ATPase domain-containing protein n=1 Tax=Snuella lapsa TaxID=870481 RepID=A0ABP6X3R4_9FLAO